MYYGTNLKSYRGLCLISQPSLAPNAREECKLKSKVLVFLDDLGGPGMGNKVSPLLLDSGVGFPCHQGAVPPHIQVQHVAEVNLA